MVHEGEAITALKFLDHPLRRIREWARYEYDSAIRHAELHRQMDDADRS